MQQQNQRCLLPNSAPNSILLSFRNMTMVQTTDDDGQTNVGS